MEYTPQQTTNKKQELIKLYNAFCSKTTIGDILKKLNVNIEGLHNYSLYNYIMAYSQSNDKKNFNFRMGGFLEWKKRNIQIKKGEKALYVLTPMFYKKDTTETTDNQTTDKKTDILRGFMLKPVFDFSQTTDFIKYETAIYDNKTDLDFNTILEFIKLNSPQIVINIKDNLSERGFYDTITKEININGDKNAYTLLHEYAHFLTHDTIKEINDLTKKGNYAKNEIIAELTSFLILKKFYNQNDFNFNYSQVWTSNLNEFDINEFNKLLNKVLLIVGGLKK